MPIVGYIDSYRLKYAILPGSDLMDNSVALSTNSASRAQDLFGPVVLDVNELAVTRCIIALLFFRLGNAAGDVKSLPFAYRQKNCKRGSGSGQRIPITPRSF